QPTEDLDAAKRCVHSVLATSDGLDLEVVLVDATGSPVVHAQLQAISAIDARVRLAWIDHDPGAGAARNLGLRASRGTFIALLDPSVELIGSPWWRLLAAFGDRGVGAAGPFGLLTADMRHFHEVEAPDTAPIEVDALQNYLLVVRRADLRRIGPL